MLLALNMAPWCCCLAGRHVCAAAVLKCFGRAACLLQTTTSHHTHCYSFNARLLEPHPAACHQLTTCRSLPMFLVSAVAPAAPPACTSPPALSTAHGRCLCL